MRPWRAALLSAGVAVILVGTGSSIAQETVLSERYSGTIPCADCSGIKTILVLNRSSQGGTDSLHDDGDVRRETRKAESVDG